MKKAVHLTGNILYGNNTKAINRHSQRQYRDAEGNVYVLDKVLDVIPSYYEAYFIPAEMRNKVHFPKTTIIGRDISWVQAKKEFAKLYNLTGVR